MVYGIKKKKDNNKISLNNTFRWSSGFTYRLKKGCCNQFCSVDIVIIEMKLKTTVCVVWLEFLKILQIKIVLVQVPFELNERRKKNVFNRSVRMSITHFALISNNVKGFHWLAPILCTLQCISVTQKFMQNHFN